MKKLLLLFISCLPFLSFGQYTNDWIPFSPLQSYSLQEYYRIPVAKEGIYRIDSNALVTGLVSVASNPTFQHGRFQIFSKGVEQHIYIYDQNQDGVLNGNDYIEFYGKPNDGTLDVPLYDDPASQANPNYSLINDTSGYYLTWVLNISPPFNTKRLQVINDTDFQSYTPASYYLKNIRRDYYASYRSGSTIQDQDFDLEYTATEGWFDFIFKSGNPANKIINTPNVFTSGPQALFETVFVGASNYSDPGQIDHKVKIEINNNLIAEIDYDGYEIRKEIITLAPTIFTSANNIKYSALNPTGTNDGDRNAISYISITYPHSMSFAGEVELFHKMIIPFNTNDSKTYLEMTGLSGSGYYIYDFTDNLRIPVVTSSGMFQALIPNAANGSDKEIALFADAGINIVNNIKAVNTPTNPRFRNFNAAGMNHDYIIITHKKLMNSATQYQNYRNSVGYNVLIVDIDELYGQFIYGVYKHPLSIRHFIKFIYEKWTTPPQHLLLLGKALHARHIRPNSDGNFPNGNDANPGTFYSPALIQANYAECLVPTMGNPSSDVLLTAKILPGKLLMPAVATGRLSVQNDQKAQDYLDKVIAYENQQADKWMKQVLHFGGGGSAAEQQQFRGFLGEYANIITSPYFGGTVDSVYKTSTEPIQINQSEIISAKIDSGVTLMTFFGHSNANSFDVSTDDPSSFNNKDRYHFVIANGCYTGDIHLTNADNKNSVSENFVLISNKGAIGFLAHPGTEYAHNFYPYSRELYKQISKTNYGGTIGNSIRNTIDSIEAPYTIVDLPLGFKTVSLGMTLHGDPAIILNSHTKPDYTISDNDISFSPQTVTTEQADFTINININNIGKAIDSSFVVEIKRKFESDESEEIFLDTVSNVYYSQVYSRIFPVDAFKGPGLNIFEVKVDYWNHVDEIDEGNNFAQAQLIIQSNDVTPVYPYEFDIVPTNTLQLKATTANPFDLTPRNYIFEIDTTDDFNSPVKQVQNIISGGGVVTSQQISLNYNQVYYWRVTLDDNGNYKWRESSFICISNTRGWSQADFYQFKKDNYYGVEYNKPDRVFDFVTVISDLKVYNSNLPLTFVPYYMINNVIEDYDACQTTPSMHIVVLDSLTHKPWETRHPFGSTILNPNNNFGNANDMGVCRTRPDKYFIFRANDPNQLQAMADMINNSVPNGNYIIAYSVFDGLFSTWQNQIYEVFENLGADSVRYLADDQPYIFFTKKGDNGSTKEIIGASKDSLEVINLNETLTTFWDRGYVESAKIGPATQWTSLHWQQHSLENPSEDSIHLDVVGINNAGNETVIISGIQPSTQTLPLASVDASVYPYLKLKAVMKDIVWRTPPQLDYWQVYYEGVPEFALNPSKYFEFYKDTVQHGENIKLAMAVENISSYDAADSILVDYYLYNKNKVRVPLNTFSNKALIAGDTLISRIEFSSLDFPELNSLWIEVNPNNHQPEQYHFNNLGEIKFYAKRDVTNPILDVTFDGIHILNGDIISPKPHIVISLKDENTFLAVDDTSNFALFLTYPDGQLQKLHFENSPTSSTDNTLLKWYPASLPNNKFKIEYTPVFLMDGKYELRVQAKDASDNISGMNEYRIEFEVINKSTITHVLNYPNPFSTSTRFVFTLTGSEIPVNFKIQIMTVTGKIVREITAAELGTIRIGRNISEYAWDGTDEYGDKLANGLYLYRVISQLNGARIERRETEADKFFTKDFGKMYILR